MDKYVSICESTFGFGPAIMAENKNTFDNIRKLPRSERDLLGSIAEKVIVNSNGLEYFVEYSNNLERFIKDQNLEFHEAVNKVCECNNIDEDSLVIVVDESCIDKLDLSALQKNFNVQRI